MKYTSEQVEILKKKFDKLNFKCRICKHDEFTVVDKLFEYREFQDGNLVVGLESSVIPIVLVSCDECGHFESFSAVRLGILDTSEKKVNDGKTGKK